MKLIARKTEQGIRKRLKTGSRRNRNRLLQNKYLALANSMSLKPTDIPMINGCV